MSMNALSHGATASPDAQEVAKWIDVITARGVLAPANCDEAVALAEAEVRLSAAQRQWRRALHDIVKPPDPAKELGRFGAMAAELLSLSEATGEPIEEGLMDLLRTADRLTRKPKRGRVPDLRLAARYLAEASSLRRKRLAAWIDCLNAIYRNE